MMRPHPLLVGMFYVALTWTALYIMFDRRIASLWTFVAVATCVVAAYYRGER